MKTREALGRLATAGHRNFSESWPLPGVEAQVSRNLAVLDHLFLGSVEAPSPLVRDRVMVLVQRWFDGHAVPELASPVNQRSFGWALHDDEFFQEPGRIRRAMQFFIENPRMQSIPGLVFLALDEPETAAREGVVKAIVRLLDRKDLVSAKLDALRARTSFYLGFERPENTAAEALTSFESWVSHHSVLPSWANTFTIQVRWIAGYFPTREMTDEECRQLCDDAASFGDVRLKKIALCLAVLGSRGRDQHDRFCQQALVEIGDAMTAAVWGFTDRPLLSMFTELVEGCRRYLKDYAVRAVLEFFFRKMTDYSADPTRLPFWVLYAKKIETIGVFSSRLLRNQLLRGLAPSEIFLAKFIRESFRPVESSAPGAAILMGFGESLVVEFTDRSNATFVYHQRGRFGGQFSHYPPQQLRDLNDLKLIKQQDGTMRPYTRETEGRLIHHEGWQQRFRSILRSNLGITP